MRIAPKSTSLKVDLKNKRLPFLVRTNLAVSQPLCLSPASQEISVNFINITDKLGDAQISPEINQLLQLHGERSCFVSDLYHRRRLQSVTMTENMSQHSVFILEERRTTSPSPLATANLENLQADMQLD